MPPSFVLNISFFQSLYCLKKLHHITLCFMSRKQISSNTDPCGTGSLPVTSVHLSLLQLLSTSVPNISIYPMGSSTPQHTDWPHRFFHIMGCCWMQRWQLWRRGHFPSALSTGSATLFQMEFSLCFFCACVCTGLDYCDALYWGLQIGNHSKAEVPKCDSPSVKLHFFHWVQDALGHLEFRLEFKILIFTHKLNSLDWFG